MRSDVPLQRRPGGKFILAVVTLKGPFPRVHSPVIFERGRICKLFPAVAAGVRLLAGVDSHMLSHIDTSGEAFPTGAAYVRLLPRVNPDVEVEVVPPGESVSADLALEGLLRGVYY